MFTRTEYKWEWEYGAFGLELHERAVTTIPSRQLTDKEAEAIGMCIKTTSIFLCNLPVKIVQWLFCFE